MYATHIGHTMPQVYSALTYLNMCTHLHAYEFIMPNTMATKSLQCQTNFPRQIYSHLLLSNAHRPKSGANFVYFGVTQ